MFGWFKSASHYQRKYERQLNKSGYNNEKLWRYFAENETFSLPKKWTRSNGVASDQADALHNSLHEGFAPDVAGNNTINYYKNIYAAAKDYSDAKEQQRWAAWSSQGKERLGQANAMQAMIRRQLMTPDKFEQMKNYLWGQFSNISTYLREHNCIPSSEIIKQTQKLIPFAALFFDITGQTASLTRLKVIKLLGSTSKDPCEEYAYTCINSLLADIKNATLPDTKPSFFSRLFKSSN